MIGSGFSCKDMADKIYPVVSVIIFQPKLGFVIYTPHVSHGGYTVHVHFPAKLTNLGAIDGQPTKSVACIRHPKVAPIEGITAR